VALFKRKQLPEQQARTPAAAAAVSSPSSSSGAGATPMSTPASTPASTLASTSASTSGSQSATQTVDPPAAGPDSGTASADSGNGPAARQAPAEKPAQHPTEEAGREKPARKQGSDKSAAGRMVDGANAVRSRIASIVWLVAVACAVVLAVAALMVALKANNDNAIVSWVKDAAHTLDLGVFSPNDGIFTPRHDPQLVKAALINWGIAAVLYLMVGKFADRIIRP